jgi:nicotinamidase-related amidase
MMKSGKALVIIDMQNDSFTPAYPQHDADGVVHCINEISSVFRKLNLPVILIQHDGTGMGEYEKNTRGYELIDELITEQSDLRIDKRANDAFYQTDLQLKLTGLGISEIYVTGCATDFCVESFVQSALTKDYHLIVVEDGHTSGDRPHVKAENLIAHYNWLWKNLNPTKGKVEVKKLEQIKKEMI